MPARKEHVLPKTGKTFTREFGGIQYTLEIVNNNNGIGYKVSNNVYRTPTAAAKSITQYEINGWSFWGLDK